MVGAAGSGHPGGSHLQRIFYYLFFKEMKVDPENLGSELTGLFYLRDMLLQFFMQPWLKKAFSLWRI